MKPPKIPLLSLLLIAATLPTPSPARDAVSLKSGDIRTGTVLSLDEHFLRMEVELPPRKNSTTSEIITATVSIPAQDVHTIKFSDTAQNILAKIPPNKLPTLQAIWKKLLPFHSNPESPTGANGNANTSALIENNQPLEAITLSQLIELQSWSDADRTAARRNRLRAMILSGQAAAAQAEARDFARLTEDPILLIEAKHILATAADESLRQLVKDNPRWQEDIFIIPERNRLYHEALDSYLYPALFFGSEEPAAARGLWAAAQLLDFCGDTTLALEYARDITFLYPQSPQAREATQFLNNHPPQDAQQPE